MDVPYLRVASRFFNQPLLLTTTSAQTIGSYLLTRMREGPRAGGVAMGETDAGETFQGFNPQETRTGAFYHTPRASRFYGEYPTDPEDGGRPKPYRRTEQGTAIITLVGEFANRGAYVGAYSGIITYEGLRYQLVKAAQDKRAKNILLDVESPGGEVIGCFETAQLVQQIAAEKPVVAVANGMICSAAFALASGATHIVTMPSAMVGSIGVVYVHLDFSKYLDQEGVKPTLLFAGDRKVDGNPYEPLSKEARAQIEADVEHYYEQFVGLVADHRKGLTAKAIKGTEAGVFTGEAAIKAGLADELGTFEDVLAELST